MTFEFNFDQEGRGDDVDRLLSQFEDAKNWEVTPHTLTFVAGYITLRITYKFEWETHTGSQRHELPIKVEALIRKENNYKKLPFEMRDTAKAMLLTRIRRKMMVKTQDAGFLHPFYIAPHKAKTKEERELLWNAKVHSRMVGGGKKKYRVVTETSVTLFLEPKKIRVLMNRTQLSILAREIKLAYLGWADAIKP